MALYHFKSPAVRPRTQPQDLFVLPQSHKCLTVQRVPLESAGARYFQYQALRVWNLLPLKIRISSFCHRLVDESSHLALYTN